MWTKEEHPPSLVQRQVPRKQAFGCLRQPSEAHNLIGDISCLHIGLWSWWYLVVLYCKDPYIHNSFFFVSLPEFWLIGFTCQIFKCFETCVLLGPLMSEMLWWFPLKHMSAPSSMIFWNHQHVLELFFGSFCLDLSWSIPYWRRCRWLAAAFTPHFMSRPEPVSFLRGKSRW